MPNQKATMIRDLVETFCANALLMLFGGLTSIIIARILGPEMRGEFAVILLWSGIFSTIVSLGINEGLGYFSGTESYQRWKYLFTAFLLTVSIIIILIIPLLLSIPFLMKSYSPKIIHLGMITIGFNLFFIPQFMLAQSFLQGCGLIRHLNYVNLLNGILYFCLICIIWIFFPRGNYDLALTLSAYIITFAILSIVSFALLSMLKKRESQILKNGILSFRYYEIKNLLRYGMPVNIANIVNQAISRLDQIFLSFFATPNLIGFYVVSLSVSVGISASFLTISAIALPRITNVLKIEEKRSVIRKLFLSYSYSSIPIFFLTLFSAPYLIPILFGSAFAGAVKASQIFSGGMLFIGLNQLCSVILKALNFPKQVMACRMLALGLLAFCLSILVPKYDIVGAAWGVLISNFLASAVIIALVGQKGGIKLLDMAIPKKEDLRAIRNMMVIYYSIFMKL